MKRRKWLKSLLTAPALAAAAASPQAAAQQAAPSAAAQPPPTRSLDDMPKLPLASPEQVAGANRRFFSEIQLAALSALCSQILPAANGRPGATEAGVPEFLDFLLAQSPAARQDLYRSGLDRLNSDCRRRYGKHFAEAGAADAAALLAPLQTAWTFETPSEVLAQFLRAAKDDILQATTNSRAWSEAMTGRSRSAAGMGQYYFPIE